MNAKRGITNSAIEPMSKKTRLDFAGGRLDVQTPFRSNGVEREEAPCDDHFFLQTPAESTSAAFLHDQVEFEEEEPEAREDAEVQEIYPDMAENMDLHGEIEGQDHQIQNVLPIEGPGQIENDCESPGQISNDRDSPGQIANNRDSPGQIAIDRERDDRLSRFDRHLDRSDFRDTEDRQNANEGDRDCFENVNIRQERNVSLADEANETRSPPDEDDHMGFLLKDMQFEVVASRFQKISDDRRASSRQCPKSRSKRNASQRTVVSVADRSPDVVQTRWRDDIRKLRAKKPDFFSNKQAMLEDDGPSRKGIPMYESLPVNQFNCLDVQNIFLMEYDWKVKNSGSYNSFLQLLTVAGQFLRLRVVTGRSQLRAMWKAGEVYRAICDREVIDLFLGMYDANAQCTTVMTKALHLRKIAEHAKLYFSDKDVHLHAESERARIKVQKMFNVQKSRGRSRAAERKTFENRVSEGTVFLPQDFRNCCDDVRRKLDGIIRFFESTAMVMGKDGAISKIQETSVIQKWSINMLLLMIFAAAGQRPQVYSQLQVPTDSELQQMKAQARRAKFFQLRTMVEKTRRSADIPNVLVPDYVLPYLEFHLSIVRDAVLDRTRVNEEAAQDKPILMHTETGEFLTTTQIRKCLRSFLESEYPGLAGVTVMSLRSSYCTMMMRLHREGEIFRNLNEERFLGLLAKNVNTSVEQLLTTYVGVDQDDFEISAKELMKCFSVENNPRR